MKTSEKIHKVRIEITGGKRVDRVGYTQCFAALAAESGGIVNAVPESDQTESQGRIYSFSEEKEKSEFLSKAHVACQDRTDHARCPLSKQVMCLIHQ